MNRQPLISVIIPTYNRLDFLAELIESLWRQTYRHLQIIVVNDNESRSTSLRSCIRSLI